MSYRAKLLLLFVGTTVFVVSLNLAIMSRQRRDLLLQQRQSKLRTLVATVAELIPADQVEQIQTRDDEKKPAYLQLENLLRKIRDANRRGEALGGADIHVEYLYILRPVADHPGLLEFVVDAEESRVNKSHVDDIYKYQGGHRLDVNILQASTDVRTDQWGRWLSANAPIRDPANGRVVGAVCADLSAERVTRNLNQAFLWGMLGMALSLPLIIGAALLLSHWVRQPLKVLESAVSAIGKGDLEARAVWPRRDEFGVLASAVNAMATGLQERERVKSAFARYVSQTVLERVMRSGDTSVLQGDRRLITVLFSDIRGFTTLAENRRPEEVVRLLNQYFERMIEISIRNHGWVDKFLGDGLMITFGAFEPDPDHEAHAIQTALEMQTALRQLSAQWAAEGLPEFGIGVGINSGYAVVGEIGSSHRVEFTALGDTVNLAARLETACRDLDVDILISEYTYQAVRGLFQVTHRGALQVKGRTSEVVAYSVEGPAVLNKTVAAQ